MSCMFVYSKLYVTASSNCTLVEYIYYEHVILLGSTTMYAYYSLSSSYDAY